MRPSPEGEPLNILPTLCGSVSDASTLVTIDASGPVASTTFEAWGERTVQLDGDGLTEDFRKFEDTLAHADAALFGSRPITTALQLARWRATICLTGLVFLANACYSMWEYRRAGPPCWASCSSFLANFTQATWSWCVWLTAAQINFFIPVFLSTRRIDIEKACLLMGALYGAMALRAMVLAVHLLFLLAGLDENTGECSQQMLLTTGFRYAAYTFSCHTSYTFFVDESGFYTTLWGWSLLQVSSIVLAFALGVGAVQDEVVSWAAAIPLLVWLIVTQCRRTRRVRQAKEAASADFQAYGQAWQAITSTESLVPLAQLASRIHKKHPWHDIRQYAQSLDQLVIDAQSVQENFCKLLRFVADRSGGRFKDAPLKKKERIFQKLRRAYANDFNKLCDIVRGSIIYESMKELQNGLEVLAKKVKIRRIKNRFDPRYVSSVTAGYRDLCLNIEIPTEKYRTPHICEVQMHHSSLFALKTDGGHRRYTYFRDLCGR
eukprot:TRINITY_DN57068_c0_g1_i1.p1 TRINITY_DN57068_c0_g1~~TRINITY_DN57068_c0_g1_i1.p1  ORF type:complete len:491 (-),score=49.09 TRINITY_DN57068_c0_g1_i1:284-1756(-)